MAVIGVAFCAFEASLTFCKKVYDYATQMDKNSDHRERIISAVACLQAAAYELKKVEEDDLSEYFKIALRKWRDSLDIAEEALKSLKKKSTVINIGATRKKLERLESELKTVCENLQLALLIAGHLQQRELKETVQEESNSIKNMVTDPGQGIYLNPHNHNRIPFTIEKPSVSTDPQNRLLIIKWVDQKNEIKELTKYDVLYDDEKNSIYPCKPQEANSSKCATEFMVKIGEERILLGNIYNIRIRAVNGAGPGKWSEASMKMFLRGPPAKPQSPSLVLQSPTEVLVKVKELSKKEERGSPVTNCQVEYTEVGDDNDTSMTSKQFQMEKQREAVCEQEFSITSLKPDTQYAFRVTMINQIGHSNPSSLRKVLTKSLVPGPPNNVRISSKRTCTMIKVRWDQPIVNPAGVYEYRVQYRKPRDTEWNTSATVSKNKHSRKVLQLQTDTTYYFRVQSMNKNGNGNTSERVKEETRYGAFGRGLATVAAGFGGTLGGPLLGATGLGYASGAAAERATDSGEAGRKAAAVAAGVAGGIGGFLLGIIGAPILGINSAIMVNLKLQGEVDIDSSQSSDEEDTDMPILVKLYRSTFQTAEALVEGND